MIARLKGKVLEKEATRLLIEASGMAFHCHVSLKTNEALPAVGKEAQIFTYFMLNNPGNMGPIYPVLYGFATQEERTMFELLLSVSRLGASKVLAALSTMTPAEIASAILQGDIRQLSTVKGIGPKQGERIVLELQEKVQKLHFGEDVQPGGRGAGQSSGTSELGEAVNALEALGFARKTAEKQIKKIMAREGSLTVEELVRLALMES